MAHRKTKRALRRERPNRAPKDGCVCRLWPEVDPDCLRHGDMVDVSRCRAVDPWDCRYVCGRPEGHRGSCDWDLIPA